MSRKFKKTKFQVEEALKSVKKLQNEVEKKCDNEGGPRWRRSRGWSCSSMLSQQQVANIAEEPPLPPPASIPGGGGVDIASTPGGDVAFGEVDHPMEEVEDPPAERELFARPKCPDVSSSPPGPRTPCTCSHVST